MLALPVLGLIVSSQNAHAQEVSAPAPNQYVIDLGIGGLLRPKYPGAEDYGVLPFPIIAVGRFFVPGVGNVGDESEAKRGFSIYPSFDFNGERKDSDSDILFGTEKVDWALELGIGAAYRYDWFRAFVEARQGINGHTGQVVDFGMDFISSPTEEIELVIGPRATWASGEVMDTYFGVSAAEAAVPGSSLTAYDAGSGFRSVGVIARASYDVTDKTTLHLQAGYDRLVGDAADSPIVNAGDEDQFSLGAGISYKFSFDIFPE
jgi:outer membrane scaffolding protein for murein synthesis (MipA/OmpV family)